jgi:hypothetical protein
LVNERNNHKTKNAGLALRSSNTTIKKPTYYLVLKIVFKYFAVAFGGFYYHFINRNRKYCPSGNPGLSG